MIKRDPETLPSRNTGSGPQSPAPNRDQDRHNSRGDYRSTPSNSNSNSWQDHNERGGREHERDGRALRAYNERGRESFGGGGDRKRSFAHPDDRGPGDRECEHFCSLSLFFCSSTLASRRSFPLVSSFCPLIMISHRFSLYFSFPPGSPRQSCRIPLGGSVLVPLPILTGCHSRTESLYVSPHASYVVFPRNQKKREKRALIHSRHLRNPIPISTDKRSRGNYQRVR